MLPLPQLKLIAEQTHHRGPQWFILIIGLLCGPDIDGNESVVRQIPILTVKDDLLIVQQEILQLGSFNRQYTYPIHEQLAAEDLFMVDICVLCLVEEDLVLVSQSPDEKGDLEVVKLG